MTSPSNTTVDYELWRRAQDRREQDLLEGLTAEQRLLAPLVLSLARLAAQRDAKSQEGLP